MAREFSYTGNGYVYGANLPDYAWMADERGWVNVSDFTSEQLRDIVGKAINSLKDESFTDNKQEVVITELANFKHKIIRNIINYSLSDVSDKNFWQSKCKGFKAGLYIYQLEDVTIPYPFDDNEVFYVGKAVDLAERLRWHFTVDNRKRLIENDQCREWFYQNYYISKKRPFNIRIIELPEDQIDKVEILVIGMFAMRYGAPPLCNNSINKNKFREYYEQISGNEKQFIEKILDIVS